MAGVGVQRRRAVAKAHTGAPQQESEIQAAPGGHLIEKTVVPSGTAIFLLAATDFYFYLILQGIIEKQEEIAKKYCDSPAFVL